MIELHHEVGHAVQDIHHLTMENGELLDREEEQEIAISELRKENKRIEYVSLARRRPVFRVLELEAKATNQKVNTQSHTVEGLDLKVVTGHFLGSKTMDMYQQ